MRLSWLLLVLLCCAGQAHAEDWYTGTSLGRPEDSLVVTGDASASYTSTTSLFTEVTGTAAVTGTLQETGVRARVDALAGTYDYKAGTGRVVGQQQEASAVVGYEVVWSDARIAGYIGGDVRNNRLSIVDPKNPVVGTAYGIKAAVDAYANPTTNTMASFYAAYATDHNAYYARARAGYSIWGNGFLGPEATLLGDDFFSQWRAGVHFSSFKIGAVSFGMSGGYLYDRIQKGGYYTTLDARIGF